MIRKSIRLWKEYLYNKSKEIQEKETAEKKRKVKEALEEGKELPTELKKERTKLIHELDHDDINTLIPKSHIDDEYEEAKFRDPYVLITTSWSPSMRLL